MKNTIKIIFTIILLSNVFLVWRCVVSFQPTETTTEYVIQSDTATSNDVLFIIDDCMYSDTIRPNTANELLLLRLQNRAMRSGLLEIKCLLNK